MTSTLCFTMPIVARDLLSNRVEDQNGLVDPEGIVAQAREMDVSSSQVRLFGKADPC